MSCTGRSEELVTRVLLSRRKCDHLSQVSIQQNRLLIWSTEVMDAGLSASADIQMDTLLSSLMSFLGIPLLVYLQVLTPISPAAF